MPIENPSNANFSTRSFLLVEDFDVMRGILRDLLRRCGAKRIDVAANAREAITILRKGRCDVILCDYHLGAGPNGQQLLEEARHEDLISASTIWIMVTAEKTSEMVMGAVENAPDDYLLKPITEASLQTRLDKLILRKTALAEIAAAMRAKEYLRALELCRKRMEQDPGNPLEILHIQSELFLLTGQTEKARKLFDSILARRDVSWAKAGLAKLLYNDGDLSRARELLEQIVADNRNYLDAYDWLARIYQRLGAWGEAEHLLQRAVQVSPNSTHRQSALGQTALHLEHLDVAEMAYQKALRLTSQSALKTTTPYLGLARVYSAQKKPQEALRMLGQLASDMPNDESRLQAKAEEVRVHHVAGNTEQAAAAAKFVTNRIQSGGETLSAQATLDLAETFMLMGNKDSASELVQFVVRNNHEDDELAARAVEVYEKGDMGAAGRELVDKMRKEAVQDMDTGVRLASQGKLDEALEWLRQARTLMPRSPRLLLNLAYVIIALMGRNGWRHDLEMEARKAIASAREISPGDKRAGELLSKLEALC